MRASQVDSGTRRVESPGFRRLDDDALRLNTARQGHGEPKPTRKVTAIRDRHDHRPMGRLGERLGRDEHDRTMVPLFPAIGGLPTMPLNAICRLNI
jgi:hypothetical protein